MHALETMPSRTLELARSGYRRAYLVVPPSRYEEALRYFAVSCAKANGRSGKVGELVVTLVASSEPVPKKSRAADYQVCLLGWEKARPEEFRSLHSWTSGAS